MEQQSSATELSKQQLSEVRRFLMSSNKNDISFKLFIDDLYNEETFPLFNKLLKGHPEVKTINNIYEIISTNKDIWKILSSKENEFILNILKKNNLIQNKSILKVQNAIAIHFLFMEFLTISGSGIVKKNREIFNFLDLYKKLKIKADNRINSFSKSIAFNSHNSPLNPLDNVPEELFGLSGYIKAPARKPVSPTINPLLYFMIETAKEENIKNHYSDFLIPTLKELKKEFPVQFKEITSFGKTYLMTRVKSGKLYSIEAEAYYLRGVGRVAI